jgi:hypothetical protein
MSGHIPIGSTGSNREDIRSTNAIRHSSRTNGKKRGLPTGTLTMSWYSTPIDARRTNRSWTLRLHQVNYDTATAGAAATSCSASNALSGRSLKPFAAIHRIEIAGRAADKITAQHHLRVAVSMLGDGAEPAPGRASADRQTAPASAEHAEGEHGAAMALLGRLLEQLQCFGWSGWIAVRVQHHLR